LAPVTAAAGVARNARSARACRSRWPLALAVVAGRQWAQATRTLASMARALAASDDLLGGLDDRAGTIRATLASSLGDAWSEARRVLLLLAALDVSDLEPDVVAAVAGCDIGAADALLQELVEQRLITPVAGGRLEDQRPASPGRVAAGCQRAGRAGDPVRTRT
jgi:hypothetical protein